MQTEFGALLDPCSLTWKGGRIAPLPDHTRITIELSQHHCAHTDWFYPPTVPVNRSPESPLVSTPYSLPATHLLTLELEKDDDEKANFIIALFGMLKGLRLQRSDWQHFYKTPLKRKLNDFCADDLEIELALEIASDFWEKHPASNIRRLAFGALHWHLFAQLYEHEFERFSAQYTAFDACYKLALELRIRDFSKTNHAERPGKLSAALAG